MHRDKMSLADEAKAAIAPAPDVGPGGPEAIRVERVRDARRRFLPYVVSGGAVSCGYLSVVMTTKGDLGAVFAAAVGAGILAGMTVGWVLLTIYRRRVQRSAVDHLPVNLAIVLLTVPAYAVAGWASAWVGWIVALALSRPTPEPGTPNAWGLLILSALVIYPLSYVFARRDLDRPDGFVKALVATKYEIHEEPRTRMVLWDFLIGLAWFVGSLVVAFSVVIGVQVLIPIFQADAVRPLLGVAFLGGWMGLTVGGTAWTLRLVHGRRSRAN